MLKGRLEILTGSRVKRILISGAILGIFPSSCLFSVTINRHGDDVISHVTRNFRIANESDLGKKERADRI